MIASHTKRKEKISIMTNCHYRPKCLTPSQIYSSSPVILQLLPPNDQGWILWLLVSGFHHVTCSGWKNEGQMAVCHSWTSRSLARFHVPCWASATVMRTSLGQLLPMQPELRTEHTWSRVTRLTDRSEAKGKVAQVNMQIDGYFKHWVLGHFGMQYYGGDIKVIQ